MTRPRLLLGLLLSLALLVLLPTAVSAQEGNPVSDDEVNEVASQLYCPVCENVPLDVCPTKACSDWRELIRQFLAEGQTTDEIKEYFSAQYGWNVLAVPPRMGLNWIIYLVPPLIIAGGALLIILLLRAAKRWQADSGQSTNDFTGLISGDYLERVDQDLEGRVKDD